MHRCMYTSLIPRPCGRPGNEARYVQVGFNQPHSQAFPGSSFDHLEYAKQRGKAQEIIVLALTSLQCVNLRGSSMPTIIELQCGD